ncbi:MAG: hypothetical protein AAF957_23685 [Planctomycetota bacterium]
MESAIAASICRLLVHRKAKNEGMSSFKRYWMGLTQYQLQSKKVIFSNRFFSDDPLSGWWVLLDKPAGSNDIILGEVSGVILAHVDPSGLAAQALGGPVTSLHGTYGLAKDAGTAKKLVRGGLASEAYGKFQAAVKAGVWSAAKGTSVEWNVALDYLICGGFISMDIKSDGRITGKSSMYTSKKDLLIGYGLAEQKGSEADGLAYCRKMVDGYQFFGPNLSFEYSPKTSKLAIQ